MEKLKWLLVGTGDIANKRIAPAIESEPRSELYAVMDIFEERANAFVRRYPVRVFTNFEKAISDPSVDTVYIATPIFLHKEQSARALRAGKHVLCEKPLALNTKEADEIVEAAVHSDKKLGVAYFRRFYPRYRMAQEMLKKGEFGQIILVRMTYFSWFNPSEDDPKYWRVIPEKSGGGPISDMGTHMIDVLVGLFDMPISVYAKAETLTHQYKVEDSVSIIMKLENGAHVVATLNWNSKTWSHEFEIIGTEAKVKWCPYDGPKIVKTVGKEINEIDMPNHDNVHYPLIEDFVSSVLEERAPLVTAEEALKTTKVVDAIYESAKKGREISL